VKTVQPRVLILMMTMRVQVMSAKKPRPNQVVGRLAGQRAVAVA
jgi:hypothetical protein